MPIRLRIAGAEVVPAYQLGWHELRNGQLLDAADNADFDAIVTADKSIQFQQSMAGRRVRLVVLKAVTNRLTVLQEMVDGLAEKVNAAEPGAIIVIEGERRS